MTTPDGPRSAAELAAALRAHLTRLESDYLGHNSKPVRDWRGMRLRFSQVGAGVLRGPRFAVWVRYHGDDPPKPLTREAAEGYLAWLDAGNGGFDAEVPGAPPPDRSPAPRSLAEIAAELQGHLTRLAADPGANPPGSRRFESPSAVVVSRRVCVLYGRVEGHTRFTRDRAEAYLLALREGFRGRHFDPDPSDG